MSTSTTATPTRSTSPRTGRGSGRLPAGLCLLGSALAVAASVTVGGIAGSSGEAVTSTLLERSGRIQAGAGLGILGSAALLLAAARLRRALPGLCGVVAGSAGAAVAVLLAGMYAAFGAGAVVADLLLEEPSGAVGEATLILVNLVEMTRHAPGLALVVAVLVARRALPAPVVLVAALLLATMLVPFTTWVAALLLPVWLGAAGALARDGAAQGPGPAADRTPAAAAA